LKIAIVANPDGEIESLYKHLEPCDYVFSIGNFGIWPDPNRLDRGTKMHKGPGDFSSLLKKGWVSPVKTIVIPGIHEDHKWLLTKIKQNELEILPNVTIQLNGYYLNLGDTNNPYKILGLGKGFSTKIFNNQYKSKPYRYLSRREVERACSTGKIDLFLTSLHSLDLPPIKSIRFATKPTLTIFMNAKNQPQPSTKSIVSLKSKEIYYVNVT